MVVTIFGKICILFSLQGDNRLVLVLKGPWILGPQGPVFTVCRLLEIEDKKGLGYL